MKVNDPTIKGKIILHQRELLQNLKYFLERETKLQKNKGHMIMSNTLYKELEHLLPKSKYHK